ncbi:MAG TPA: cyclic peptide export ABC transporter [Burkholderiaceae bacterium]
MNLLAYLYRQSRRLLILAMLTGILGGLSGACLVSVISEAISGTGKLASIAPLAWMFFGLCAVSLISKATSEIVLLNLTQSAIFKLRVDISRKLLATPHKRLQELGKHGLLVILTKDIDIFVQAFQYLPAGFGNVIVILACLGYMAWLSWPMLLVFLAVLVVSVVLYQAAERRPRRHLATVREKMDALYQNFRGLVEGSKELQLNAERGRRFVDEVITPGARDFRLTFVRGMSGYTWVANSGTMLFYLMIGAVLFIVPHWLPQSTVVLTSFTLVLLYLIRPIGELMYALPMVRQAAISLGKIEQLNGQLDEEPTADNTRIRRDGKQDFKPGFNGDQTLLQLRGVCHHYPGAQEDSHFMLGPIDLDIARGEILFVVGGNGSGKTTFAMLLLGLYEPEAGHIRLNGAMVDESNLHAYRQEFTGVFADFHLFEQLLTAGDYESQMRANHYLNVLQMQHKVKVENGRFSTINLSTGQRKRLALVGAYLEDRPIYLFDEWAADQDPVFKRVFYTELLPDLKARGKTVIVITHDDAYFSCADRIIKVEDGKIREVENALLEFAA